MEYILEVKNLRKEFKNFTLKDINLNLEQDILWVYWTEWSRKIYYN